jgi:hypothetical protein
MTRTFKLSAFLLIASTSWCCTASSASSNKPCDTSAPLAVTAKQSRPVKEANKAASPETQSHLCGAPTKTGGTCTRKVKGEGLCFQHRDKVK